MRFLTKRFGQHASSRDPAQWQTERTSEWSVDAHIVDCDREWYLHSVADGPRYLPLRGAEMLGATIIDALFTPAHDVSQLRRENQELRAELSAIRSMLAIRALNVGPSAPSTSLLGETQRKISAVAESLPAGFSLTVGGDLGSEGELHAELSFPNSTANRELARGVVASIIDVSDVPVVTRLKPIE